MKPILLCLLAAATAAQAQYFQQEVNHRIEVRLDDEAHVLRGEIETEYVNNSPEALTELWLHIWPNAYEGPTSALAKQQFREGNLLMYWAMARDLGGIDSLNFAVNGRPAQWTYHPEHRDIVRVELAEPLAPGADLVYTTPFRVKLPSGQISRLGHIGQSYQITQWYPKPAVYDRDGWHAMPYLNQGEFYSEYGSFDVRITLPANYTVGATGDFVPGSADNAREAARLDSLVADTELAFTNGTAHGRSMDFPASSARLKTLHYRQSNVHDFAWFADKRWLVLRGAVAEPAVTTWSMFTPAEAHLWENAPEYLHDAIVSYSKWNGDYPYAQVTAVDGTISAGGGMEYPNVTVIGRSGSDLGLETVIVHEVGHNWFYGILGTNERTHAWMDEGINSFNETRYFVEKYGDTLSLVGRGSGPMGLFAGFEATQFPYAMRDQFAYLLTARMSVDQPMACHSDDFSGLNYGTVVYKKSAAAMEHLRGALGTAVFDAGMQLYFDRWKFRHPGPDDLRAALEEASGADLSWFFDELVPTTGQVDYRLARVRRAGEQAEVTVVNAGEVASPWRLDALDAAGEVLQTTWHSGGAGKQRVTVDAPEGVDRWTLDAAGQTLEYDRRDNSLRAHGLLRGVEPVSLRFLTRLDREDRTPVFWAPVAWWGQNDGVMAGLLLHNVTLPFRDFRWHVAPMRTFDTQRWVGTAGLSYRTGEWTWEAAVRRFGDGLEPGIARASYTRRLLAATGKFNRAPQSPLKSDLRVEFADVQLQKEFSDLFIDVLYPTDWVQSIGMNYRVQSSGLRTESEWSLRLRSLRQRAVWGDLAPIWEGAREARAVMLTGQTAWQYNRDGKALTWRGFAGWVTGDDGVYPLQAAGLSAQFDPLYEGLFFSRGATSGWGSRKIQNDHAGLALPSTALAAEEVYVSTTVSCELPMRLPLSLYAGAGLADGQGIATAGASLAFGPFQLWVPLAAPGMGAEPYRPWEGFRWSWNLLGNNLLDAIESGLN